MKDFKKGMKISKKKRKIVEKETLNSAVNLLALPVLQAR